MGGSERSPSTVWGRRGGEEGGADPPHGSRPGAVFLNDVSQQLVLPTIHSYLSLYSAHAAHRISWPRARSRRSLLINPACCFFWVGGVGMTVLSLK